MVTWRDRAACLGVDPELFFPDGNAGRALLQLDRSYVAFDGESVL